jgi:hypothetical protein
LGDSLTSIGTHTFEGCTSLASVTIGDSLTRLEYNTFANCTSLSNVSFGSGITKIGQSAFSGCTSLSSITIPESVTEVGGFCFQNCSNLSNITCLGNVAPSIESSTFKGVKPGGTLTYPAGSDYSSWLSKSAYRLGFYWWNDIPKPDIIASIVATSTTEYTQLMYYVSPWAPDIPEVLIDDSILLTGDSRFKYIFPTTGLHTVKYLFTGTTGTLQERCFSGCTSLSSVILPDTVTSIGGNCFQGCTSLSSVTFGNELAKIGQAAFNGCTSLSSITIPESVTELNNYSFPPFSGCTNLTSVTINSNAVLRLGNTDPRNSTGRLFGPQVTHYILGTGITVIGNYCFASSTSLSKITCYASPAPSFTGSQHFYSVPTGGILEYPAGTDYSTWFTRLPSGWTGQEI